MATLAEIRAKLQQQSSQTGRASSGDNAIFRHWDIAEGSTATLRFLPDGDANNTFFWVERAMIKLPFAGIKGETNSRPLIVQVPCMEMWNEACPILAEVRPWYKDESLKLTANKYWKKRSYLFQGFVVDSKLQEDKVPENIIRRFIISPQLIPIIKAGLLDPEILETPTDYVRGLDFNIKKTGKGGHADYSTSTWARRERALNNAELAAIDQYGLYDLKSFLPKKPGDVELKVMMEMFESSVDGEAYDADRWGQYFKAPGQGNASNNDEASAPSSLRTMAKLQPPQVDDEEDTPDTASTPSASSDASTRAADILNMIRNRQK